MGCFVKVRIIWFRCFNAHLPLSYRALDASPVSIASSTASVSVMLPKVYATTEAAVCQSFGRYLVVGVGVRIQGEELHQLVKICCDHIHNDFAISHGVYKKLTVLIFVSSHPL